MDKYWYHCCGFVKMPLGGQKINEIIDGFNEDDKLIMQSLFGINYDKPLQLTNENKNNYARFENVLKIKIKSAIYANFAENYYVDYETLVSDGGYTNIYGEWIPISNDNELSYDITRESPLR